MRLFPLLLLGFIATPLVELFILIEVGSVIGALPAVLLCIATAALGAALVRAQGLRTLREVQDATRRGEVPAVAMLEGVVLALAGVLLLTPGLVTDAIGFAALLPPLRRGLLLRGLRAHLRPHFAASSEHRPGGGVTVEGKFQRRNEPSARIER